MAYKKATAEERAAKIAAVKDRLETLRATVAETESWREFLSVAEARGNTFHNYSVNNWMLIYGACPTATYVASFARWKQLGRSVKKGQKGIQILTPVKYAKRGADGETLRDKDGNDVTGLSFKVGHVFDYSQTEPMKGKDAWTPDAR